MRLEVGRLAHLAATLDASHATSVELASRLATRRVHRRARDPLMLHGNTVRLLWSFNGSPSWRVGVLIHDPDRSVAKRTHYMLIFGCASVLAFDETFDSAARGDECGVGGKTSHLFAGPLVSSWFRRAASLLLSVRVRAGAGSACSPVGRSYGTADSKCSQPLAAAGASAGEYEKRLQCSDVYGRASQSARLRARAAG